MTDKITLTRAEYDLLLDALEHATTLLGRASWSLYDMPNRERVIKAHQKTVFVHRTLLVKSWDID